MGQGQLPAGQHHVGGAGDNEAYLSGQAAFIANTGSVGIDGRDEQIENYQATIRAVARGRACSWLSLHAELGLDH